VRSGVDGQPAVLELIRRLDGLELAAKCAKPASRASMGTCSPAPANDRLLSIAQAAGLDDS
jgi:hypothetical protein